MPFVTEYTPTEALFALAQKAGKAEGLKTGAQIAIQFQQLEQQKRQATTDAYLRQMAMKQDAEQAADRLQFDYANLGQRQDSLQFDREQFEKTYDLQTAIEERKQQESMTPTQQYQQYVAKEAAKTDLKLQSKAIESQMEGLEYDRRKKIDFGYDKSLKGMSTTNPVVTNLEMDYKEALKEQLDAVKAAERWGSMYKNADKATKRTLDEQEKAVQNKVKAASDKAVAIKKAIQKARLESSVSETQGLVTGDTPSTDGRYPKGTVKYKEGIKYVSDGTRFVKVK
jgi:hypothetical protein